MSTWMSIGFDPDQMDPVTEPNTQAAVSLAGDDAAPRQAGGLNRATPSEFGAVNALNGTDCGCHQAPRRT
jgi:hypothetical protein